MRPNNVDLAALLGLYQPLVGVRLNLAIDAAGSVSGATGSSDDVSNALDRAVLVHLRKISDVIVTSGKTARAENLRASKHAPMVVLTQSGEGLEHMLNGPDAKPVTLLVPGGSLLADLHPRSVLTHLRAGECSQILLEFGPRLIALWSEAGLIDEVCLTVTGQPNSEATARSLLPDFIESDNAVLLTDFFSADTKTRFLRFSLR